MGRTLPIPHAGRSGSSSDRSISTSADTAPARRAPSAESIRRWVAGQGLPAYRGEQVLRWLFQRGAASFAAMSNLSTALRASLEKEFDLPLLPAPHVSRSTDGTRKLLFQLDGGASIESVIIPDPPRLTVCISSQAGCAMGCRFCATARLGWQRQLGAGEIAAQLLAAQRELTSDERVTNVVFMGMGEPLANYDAVTEAIEILLADWGFGLSGRRITVSTVGLLPQLERLVRETPVSIAVSLTATADALRDDLMPVNRRYPLDQLIEVCRNLPIPQRRRITFEYVLLAGVNDTPSDAARLVRLLHGIRSKVNLIPFNPFPGSGFERPTPEAIRDFQQRLLAAGMHASVRTSRGRDIQAACGQLAASAAAGEL
jgi:23S rRNA (adenine2503-C2)-methyltransferase